MRRDILRCTQAAAAVEYAMVLPVLILFLLGIIDIGRYMWEINQVEKATQMGVRAAVVSDLVPSDLASRNYGTVLGQGAPIPTSAFGGVTCTGTASSVACTCISTCTGLNLSNVNNTAFGAIYQRMNLISKVVARTNVTIRYVNSGLGYAGTPEPPTAGTYNPDVAPIVTVEASQIPFTPLIFRFFGLNLKLPTQSASLTLEDGRGSATTSN